MQPHEYPRRILLAVTGLSPQVVTETLYALTQRQRPAFVPTEVRLITTATGAREARLNLLAEKTGWFHRLLAEYRLPAIRFDADCIHVLDDGHGRALDDIRTPAQNERAADFITGIVRSLTEDDSAALHVSLAGGRKTMGYYLGYALSLYGRAQDALSHVLVSEPFENNREFFYPTRNEHPIRVRRSDKEQTFDCREAQVDLAPIPFVRLRDNMQHAGALRIDHVMMLARLYWVPRGASPTDGAYVHYPFDDLLGIVALESRRNRCVVIGEDLGTVPDEVREKLGAAGVLSYRLLYFERRANRDFIAPNEYPRQALVAIGTHDLPPLAGWWEGRDLALRASLSLFPRPEQREQQLIERAQDRARLLLALEREGLLPEGITADPLSAPSMTPALAQAIHRYIARTPAAIAVVQLEDVIEAVEQMNMPATTREHPNWQRKLTLPLERWANDARFVALVRALHLERGGGAVHERAGGRA